MQVFVLGKAPHTAKTRLAPVLDREGRARLAHAMLADTLGTVTTAKSVRAVTLVSDDNRLAGLANSLNARFLHQSPASDMNGAAAQALAATDAEIGPALILHADLPFLRASDLDDLHTLWREGSVIAAPSIDGGTNALLIDADREWRFAYGPDSFKAHAAVARSLGRAYRALTRASLACDLDDPVMLARLRRPAFRGQCGPHTQTALSHNTPRVPLRSYA